MSSQLPKPVSLRSLIIQNLISTLLLLFVGTLVTDGGRMGLIMLLSCAAFWLCAAGPIIRKMQGANDEFFMKYGLYFALGITMAVAWVIGKLG